jgi:hypothetical protein
MTTATQLLLDESEKVCARRDRRVVTDDRGRTVVRIVVRPPETHGNAWVGSGR